MKSDGRYTVKVNIDIDAKTLRFATQAGLRLQQLTFVTPIDDPHGNFVEGKQAVMDLHLKPSTLAGMQTTGIHAVESFLLPRGRYTVREVVRGLCRIASPLRTRLSTCPDSRAARISHNRSLQSPRGVKASALPPGFRPARSEYTLSISLFSWTAQTSVQKSSN